MKVKDLMESLQKADPEMEVMVYADHGQWCLPASCADSDYVDEDGELIHPDDLDQNDIEGYTQYFVISD